MRKKKTNGSKEHQSMQTGVWCICLLDSSGQLLCRDSLMFHAAHVALSLHQISVDYAALAMCSIIVVNRHTQVFSLGSPDISPLLMAACTCTDYVIAICLTFLSN